MQIKSWHLTIILILLILSLSFTVNLSDETYHSYRIKLINYTKEPSKDQHARYLLESQENSDESANEDTLYANPIYVKIKDMKFIPNKLTIPLGTTVVWVNEDWTGFYGRVHLIFSITNKFRSPRMLYNTTYNFTFEEPGIYKYIDPTYQSKYSGGILTPPGTIYVDKQ